MNMNDLLGISTTLFVVYVISRIGAYRTAKGIGMSVGYVGMICLAIAGAWCGFWLLYFLGLATLGIGKAITGAGQ